MSQRFRYFASILLFVCAVASFVGAQEACTPFGRSVARTAIDVVAATCIVANSDKSDAEVKQICGIVDALDDPMKELLKSSREQVAIARDRAAFSADVRCHFEKLQGDAGPRFDAGVR